MTLKHILSEAYSHVANTWCVAAMLQMTVTKPRPTMLIFLPIILLSSAQKSNPLCSMLCP